MTTTSAETPPIVELIAPLIIDTDRQRYVLKAADEPKIAQRLRSGTLDARRRQCVELVEFAYVLTHELDCAEIGLRLVTIALDALPDDGATADLRRKAADLRQHAESLRRLEGRALALPEAPTAPQAGQIKNSPLARFQLAVPTEKS